MDINSNKNNLLIFTITIGVISILLSAAVSIIYMRSQGNIGVSDLILSEHTIVSPGDTSEYLWGIDPVKMENGSVVISGWLVPRYSDLTYANYSILLEETDGSLWELDTVMFERGLTGYFDNDFNYNNGGLYTQYPLEKLTSEKYHVYYAMENLQNDIIIFDTGTIFCPDELTD